MNPDHPEESAPLDLQELAADIEALLALCANLEAENSRLRALNTRLQAEKKQLAQKNQLSQDQIESMINRLKTLEVEL